MKNYGIMGGTFNPIHVGHLMISEYIRQNYNLDEVIFVPTGNPPHKKTEDAQLRYDMVNLAISENPNFSISDIELKRKGISYTIDTILELKQQYQGKLYFIIGSDTIFQLKTWKKIDQLFKEVEFICAIRPDYVSSEILKIELQYLSNKYGAKINIIDTPMYEISSTDLRNRLKERKSVKYLVPDSVIDYIYTRNLYR